MKSTKKSSKAKQTKPPQRQSRKPGIESRMHPRPASKMREYRASGRLHGQGSPHLIEFNT